MLVEVEVLSGRFAGKGFALDAGVHVLDSGCAAVHSLHKHKPEQVKVRPYVAEPVEEPEEVLEEHEEKIPEAESTAENLLGQIEDSEVDVEDEEPVEEPAEEPVVESRNEIEKSKPKPKTGRQARRAAYQRSDAKK